MFIREGSDIHLEFGDFRFPQMPEDKETVLVLAGDIGLICQPTLRDQLGAFLFDCSVRFREVVYVLGNHEHYHFNIDKTYFAIKSLIAKLGLENVYLLDNETKTIDNVAFVGATLWTDYDNHDPVKMVGASRAMTDHRVIEIGVSADSGWGVFCPEDAYRLHLASKKFVFDEAKKQKAAGNKVVVVVHHGVSSKSTHERFASSPFNSAFTSQLDNDVLEAQPDVLFHGHTHECFDYKIGETHVIVNPRGYTGKEYNTFDPTLRIEI